MNRHIEIDIGNNLHYQAGDHLGVFPENAIELVENLALRLKADLDAVIAVVPVESALTDSINIFLQVLKHVWLFDVKLSSDSDLQTAARESILGPATVRQILMEAIDITTPPRKAVLKALSEYPCEYNFQKKQTNKKKKPNDDTKHKYLIPLYLVCCVFVVIV